MIEAATDHAIDVLQPSIETARDAAFKGHEATRLKWALYATERSKLNPPDSELEQAPRRRARQRRLRGHHSDGNVRPRSLLSALAGSNAPETYAAGEPTPRDRDELRRTLIVLGVVVFTIVLSILVKKDKGLYVVGYIIAIVHVMGGPRRRNHPWSEVGIKPRGDFLKDLKKVWYLLAIVVLLFQLLPPEFGVAQLFGYYHQLVHHIADRASQVPLLVFVAALSSLFETIVYQVFIQERLSWFIGTPAALLVAVVIAGFAHAATLTSGGFHVVLTDSAGVALDFAVFGIIWARTRNLAVVWATHYATDIVGLIALTFMF